MPGEVVLAGAEAPARRVNARVNASELLRSRPVASTPLFGLHRCPIGSQGEPILLMSVPKRVLRRAVDRNTVRRLARESLRERRSQAAGSALFLRLKRQPTGFDALTQRARKTVWRAELARVFSLGVGHA